MAQQGVAACGFWSWARLLGICKVPLNVLRDQVYHSLMRFPFLTLLVTVIVFSAEAQRPDPDQEPYWARYTFVEDSSVLVPLRGNYRVYHLEAGMWWSYHEPQYPVRDLPQDGIRLLPLFRDGSPAFRTTPARGLDFPEVRLVVVRERDTMVVELSTYRANSRYDVDDRCTRIDCRRRPPVVLPFRPGRYLTNGTPFGPDGNAAGDTRTKELTQQFDQLWSRAMKEDRVIPQLNTETCRYEVDVPADLDVPDTLGRNTDVWLLRSAYCGTHLVKFPAWGTETAYRVVGGPGSGVDTTGKNAQLHFFMDQEDKQWLNVSGWPPGDYAVSLLACGNGGSFVLKLR